MVTQDQFTQVSKKVFDIPAEDFTINIELFLHSFKNVELVRQNWFVSKATTPGREPRFSDLLSDTLPLRHTLFLIYEYIEEYKILLTLYSLLFNCICICICIIFFDYFGDTKDVAELHLYSFFFTLYSLFVFVFVFV
jgi:hypothetical protein